MNDLDGGGDRSRRGKRGWALALIALGLGMGAGGAALAMGWDGNSRKNRRYLEDELTEALRARAVVWAFGVLMAGGTVALCVGLWRPEMGVADLPFAMVAAGATAALRFALLDREAGRDG
jgi:hypothetical protein